MKKILTVLTTLAITASMSTCAFAETDIVEISQREGNIVDFVMYEEGTPQTYTGRHYNQKEEVVADRITNEYLYSADGKRRAYVYSEKHYRVYRRRVGDDDYKVFLYHEYHTTWRGEEKNSAGAWEVVVAKKSEVTRERSALESLLGILYH